MRHRVGVTLFLFVLSLLIEVSVQNQYWVTIGVDENQRDYSSFVVSATVNCSSTQNSTITCNSKSSQISLTTYGLLEAACCNYYSWDYYSWSITVYSSTFSVLLKNVIDGQTHDSAQCSSSQTFNLCSSGTISCVFPETSSTEVLSINVCPVCTIG